MDTNSVKINIHQFEIGNFVSIGIEFGGLKMDLKVLPGLAGLLDGGIPANFFPGSSSQFLKIPPMSVKPGCFTPLLSSNCTSYIP